MIRNVKVKTEIPLHLRPLLLPVEAVVRAFSLLKALCKNPAFLTLFKLFALLLLRQLNI